jgi:hypothetical protein
MIEWLVKNSRFGEIESLIWNPWYPKSEHVDRVVPRTGKVSLKS